MLLLKEKIEIIKYKPKYKQQVQNVCIFQSTSRYKDDNALDEVCGYILCAKDLKAYKKMHILII